MYQIGRLSRVTAAFLIAPAFLAAACSAPPDHVSKSEPASGHAAAGARPGDDDGATPMVRTPPPAEAIAVVRNFAMVWARPNLDAYTWLVGVRPYVAPNYAALLASVDPANIPATTVTGPPAPVSSTTAVLVADVPTDAGTLRVTCDDMAGQWLIVSTAWETR